MAFLVIGLNSRARILSHSEGGRVPRRVLRRQNAFRGFRAQVPPDSSPRGELTVTSTDVWEALVAIREARARRERTAENRKYIFLIESNFHYFPSLIIK